MKQNVAHYQNLRCQCEESDEKLVICGNCVMVNLLCKDVQAETEREQKVLNFLARVRPSKIAEKLGVDRKTIYRWRENKHIPAEFLDRLYAPEK